MNPLITCIVVGDDRRVKFDANAVVAVDSFFKGEADGVLDGVVDSCVDVLDVCRPIPFGVVVDPLGIAGCAFDSCVEGVNVVPDTLNVVDPFV